MSTSITISILRLSAELRRTDMNSIKWYYDILNFELATCWYTGITYR